MVEWQGRERKDGWMKGRKERRKERKVGRKGEGRAGQDRAGKGRGGEGRGKSCIYSYAPVAPAEMLLVSPPTSPP